MLEADEAIHDGIRKNIGKAQESIRKKDHADLKNNQAALSPTKISMWKLSTPRINS